MSKLFIYIMSFNLERFDNAFLSIVENEFSTEEQKGFCRAF